MTDPEVARRADVLVVLPTLGERLDYLEQSLASVADQRHHVDLTLVVVLPQDATEARALASRYGALVVDDPRLGISRAINAGIEAADGEQYYAWIGDDDLFRYGGLAHLKSLIESRPDAVLAYSGCDYIDDDGNVLLTSRFGRLARWLLPVGPSLIPHPGSLIRLDAMREVGLFDEGLRYAMDLDLFLALRSKGRFVSSRRSVTAFRWHSSSLTVANKRSSNAEADAVRVRHLPRALRPFHQLWHAPIRWASVRAANNVSGRARGHRDGASAAVR
jgi:glycosyltransferase involved in cell wall biosynthesis